MIRIGRMINVMGTIKMDLPSFGGEQEEVHLPFLPFEEVPKMNISTSHIKFFEYNPDKESEGNEPWPAYSRGNIFISGIRIDGRLVKRNILLKGEPGGVFTMKRKKDGLYCGRLCLLKCPPNVIIKIDHVYEDVMRKDRTIPDLRWIYKHMGWY
jgi:hypothetical protein